MVQNREKESEFLCSMPRETIGGFQIFFFFFSFRIGLDVTPVYFYCFLQFYFFIFIFKNFFNFKIFNSYMRSQTDSRFLKGELHRGWIREGWGEMKQEDQLGCCIV